MKTVKEPLQKAKFIIVNRNEEEIRVMIPWPKDDDNFELDIRPGGASIRFHDNKEFSAFRKKINSMTSRSYYRKYSVH